VVQLPPAVPAKLFNLLIYFCSAFAATTKIEILRTHGGPADPNSAARSNHVSECRVARRGATPTDILAGVGTHPR
jgi:hypothetical protein